MIIPVTVIRGFRTLISQKRRQEIIRARGSTGDHLQSRRRRRRRRRGFRTRGTPEKWDRRSNSKSVCSARMCGIHLCIKIQYNFFFIVYIIIIIVHCVEFCTKCSTLYV